MSETISIEDQIRDLIDEAYVNIVKGSDLVQKIELDPKDGSIGLTQFANSNTWTQGCKTIFSVDSNSFDPFGVYGVEEFSSSEVICECEGTVHEILGRPAFSVEIEKFQLNPEKNLRVIPKIEFWNALDNEDEIQYDVDEAMSQYNEIMGTASIESQIRELVDKAYLNLVKGSDYVQNIELDPRDGFIELNSTWTKGCKTIFSVSPRFFDPYRKMDLKFFSHDAVIAECEGTVHEKCGRPAMSVEIEKFRMRPRNNVRVIPKIEFWNALDNEDEIQAVVDEAMRKYRNIMEASKEERPPSSIEDHIREMVDKAHANIVNGSTMDQHIELDPENGSIGLTQFPDSNTRTQGCKTILSVESWFDPFFDMGVYEFENGNVISECDGTVHEKLGRPATADEIAESLLGEGKNMRVMSRLEFWNALDNEDFIQEHVDEAMSLYNEIMGVYE